MKRTRNTVGALAASLALIAGTSNSLGAPGANEWIELPVVINLYNGTNVSEADAKKYIERANEVFKQAKIKLKIAKVNKNFMVGNNDAKQSGTEDAEAERKGKKELKDNTKGKGIKINFTDDPWTEKGGTVNGWAKHKSPVIFLRKNPDPNAAKSCEKTGNTVAHEICHVLTINYDLYGNNEKDRLTYGRDDRTDTKLTDAEKEEIRKEAAKRGKVQKKDAGATPSTKKRKETGLGFNEDPASPQDHLGISDAMMTGSETEGDIACRILTNGFYPFGAPDNYLFLIDIDANPATGQNFVGFEGIERVIQVFPEVPGFAFAQGLDLMNPTNDIFLNGTIIEERKFPETLAPATEPSDPAFDAIDVDVPAGWFGFDPGLADIVPVIAASGGPFGIVDVLPFEFDLLDGDRGPIVVTSDGEIDAAGGEMVDVSGLGFPGGASIEVELDDLVLGTIPAQPDGSFNAVFALDPATLTDTYFLTASDPVSGEFGFAVIDVLGAAGPCNPADLAPPFGTLSFGDISAFIAAFSASDPAADLAAPFGSFTFGDISAFIAAFSAGCP
jgi:hypothetical protein